MEKVERDIYGEKCVAGSSCLEETLWSLPDIATIVRSVGADTCAAS